MKPCNDYPISFPYGATTEPYSPTHPHRGDDRACPTGTPIYVGSRIIGLVGATGWATGSHLHLQEWTGDVANTRKPQNAFGGGVVTATGTGTQWGNYVTITKDGWNSTYCHLSKINVKKGEIMAGVDCKECRKPLKEDVQDYFVAWEKRQPTTAEYKDYMSKDWRYLADKILTSQKNKNLAIINKQSAEIIGLSQTVNEKQAEIDTIQDEVTDLTAENKELKALLAVCGEDTINLNKLGEMARWFIQRLGLK